MFLYVPLAKKDLVVAEIAIPAKGLALHHRHAVLDAQIGLSLLREEHPNGKFSVEAPKVEAPKVEAEIVEAPKGDAEVVEPAAEPKRRERKAE